MFVNLGWMAAWLCGRLTCWLPDWVTGWLVYLVSNKKLQYFFWCPTINSGLEDEAEQENWLAKNARQILTLGYSLSSLLLICFAFAAFSFHFALLFLFCSWWLTEGERVDKEGGRSQASMATAATGRGRFHVVEPQLNVFFQLLFCLFLPHSLAVSPFVWVFLGYFNFGTCRFKYCRQ